MEVFHIGKHKEGFSILLLLFFCCVLRQQWSWTIMSWQQLFAGGQDSKTMLSVWCVCWIALVTTDWRQTDRHVTRWTPVHYLTIVNKFNNLLNFINVYQISYTVLNYWRQYIKVVYQLQPHHHKRYSYLLRFLHKHNICNYQLGFFSGSRTFCRTDLVLTTAPAINYTLQFVTHCVQLVGLSLLPT